MLSNLEKVARIELMAPLILLVGSLFWLNLPESQPTTPTQTAIEQAESVTIRQADSSKPPSCEEPRRGHHHRPPPPPPVTLIFLVGLCLGYIIARLGPPPHHKKRCHKQHHEEP